ncbi:NosD domain-containing protein [Microbulbifer sp. VAAF005]|uniref:NosD domain-containing protein n=1 Tax=Microbulbifer sp. VAAF005 TaxID=3034230 RepID=UPI0024AC9CA9|nr:NosD domain-containing protein [Microbulbifer sp. VAAF005]WHI49133.1 right-handed parallel beta-helix repeat-containing protein [Microbulbifer sp. VAAF005]
MSRNVVSKSLITSLAVSFLAMPLILQANGAVECGDTITSRVVLDQDLLCDVTPALTVTGPTGYLDLNGYTLSCDGATVGILVNGMSAIVSGGVFKDGFVSNCNTGISVEGSGIHNLLGLNTSGNSSSGIEFVSSNNTLIQSNISDNTGTGIIIAGGSNNLFSNDISRNEITGIQVDGSSSIISSNTVSDNVLTGIQINNAGSCLISQNTVENNGTEGSNTAGILMELFGQTGNSIVGNTVSGNEDFDLQDDNSEPCENSWIGNTPDATTSGECVTSN